MISILVCHLAFSRLPCVNTVESLRLHCVGTRGRIDVGRHDLGGGGIDILIDQLDLKGVGVGSGVNSQSASAH